MSAINDVGNIRGSLDDALKKELVSRLWLWLDAHADDEVLKINWVIIRKTFRYRDLFPVFVQFLGPDPMGKTGPSTN